MSFQLFGFKCCLGLGFRAEGSGFRVWGWVQILGLFGSRWTIALANPSKPNMRRNLLVVCRGSRNGAETESTLEGLQCGQGQHVVTPVDKASYNTPIIKP